MAKFVKVHCKDTKKVAILLFHCPGCNSDHGFHVNNSSDVNWEWNGEIDKATFSPSLLVGYKNFTVNRCHSFVKEGKIQFLGDCYHKLKNKTVEIPDFEESRKAQNG